MKSVSVPQRKAYDISRLLLMLCILALAVLSVYGQAMQYAFISIDDGVYVSNNPHVRSGLSLENIRWAFSLDSSRSTGMYYQPLAWISLMMDSQLFGANPGAYHLVNICFHISNTVLLFFLLLKMTQAFWRSLFVAALFALHPVNVETVAWISERKNLLNTFLWLLTILGYWSYAKRPGIGRYTVVLLLLLLALLSKPMVVTLPFILLLLDYWPLGRIRIGAGQENAALPPGWSSGKRLLFLVLEKVPFCVLIAFYIFQFYFSLQIHEQIVPNEIRPMSLRLEHAVVSYVVYIVRMILPHNLAIFHPYPLFVPAWKVAGAFLLLTGITAVALAKMKTAPYLIVGWFWYLVSLVPVLGIVQGGQWPAFAWRWAYVPFIGIFIVLTWGMQPVVEKVKLSRMTVICVSIIILAFFGGMTWMQTGYWKDSSTLVSYALSVTKDNDLMHTSMGNEYEHHGQIDKAFDEYEEAVRINPRNATMQCNLARVLAQKGRYDESMEHFSAAVRLQPQNPTIHFSMGFAFAQFYEWQRAVDSYRKALYLDPYRSLFYNNLGNAYAAQGKFHEAIAEYRKALQLQPDYASAYGNLGNAFLSLGRYDEAIRQYEQALRISPNFAFARINLHKAQAEVEKARKQRNM